MIFIYMYVLAKMLMAWPAAGSRVRRLRGTKEIGFSKNFVNDNATKYPDNATALRPLSTLTFRHRASSI